MIRLNRRLLFAALGATIAGLAVPTPSVAQEAKLPVVATFSILGDFVERVGGERVAVKTLVGPNGDAHVYEPTPSDAKALAAAKLVFVNGIGFEGWMARLAKASGTRAPVVTATTGITPREMVDDDHDEALAKEAKKGHGHAHEGHDHGGLDPHAWQSIANVKLYVANIRDGLVAADPAGKSVYEANAAKYLGELDVLEAEVKAKIAGVPAERRRVITGHDAFGYFAAAYGIEFLAPQGISTESEVTAKAVAKLIRQIRAEKITAVFVENMTDRRLIERVAKETGVTPGGELFADALSPKGGPAPTYVDMVRHNVTLLTRAMIGS
ncbi:MAG: metal ABC transporter substrate-binding protein [Siculibacillus sp.]|nr:metal ABC transporter substrate-binding protein [Siculibacillus sp.]